MKKVFVPVLMLLALAGCSQSNIQPLEDSNRATSESRPLPSGVELSSEGSPSERDLMEGYWASMASGMVNPTDKDRDDFFKANECFIVELTKGLKEEDAKVIAEGKSHLQELSPQAVDVVTKAAGTCEGK